MRDALNHRIAVLAGGPSCERDISLLSGAAVLSALQEKGLSCFSLDPDGDFVRVLKKERAAIAFLALHGTFGEDGTIQRLLEREGIPYTGSGSEASRKAFDKIEAQTRCRAAGIRVPEFEVVDARSADRSRPPFLPAVVKPARSGSSCGVTIVREAGDFARACEDAFRFSDTLLVDRFIPGREITVGILGNETLAPVEIVPQRPFYDFDAKYAETGTRYEVPARLPAAAAEELSEMALSAFRVLGCEVLGRADFMLDAEGKPYFLEINTIPGMTNRSLLPKAARARGIDFSDLCVKIIDLSWRRIQHRGQTRTKPLEKEKFGVRA